MHERASPEATEHLPHIRVLIRALSRKNPFEPLAGPHAENKEQAREEPVPAVAPEAAHGGDVPYAARVEGREERERVVRRQRRQ